ncbi:LysM domain-containing protein [Arthrobacter sp. 49Tsu3.1M3]|uniref:LysM peptidoglycan-binding domain-containing protein n=1 Tax=Arthrobacter sp. 49Tsu3.1M3 TaxID=1279029 RepID=UPI0009A6E021|nr:LysM peptidoglycan-binding domain-containing protein [Arthrobacter sp. 49Tsu3.1M3]SKC06891.1 LysM domain-containing protein [Arthrobacter sp. 49Tsu3.1M3]
MSHDQSVAELLSAADPALTVTEDELIRSRQRSLSFVNPEVTYLTVGGSVHDFHRAPDKRHWRPFAAAGLVAAAVASCIVIASDLVEHPDETAAAPSTTATALATPSGPGKPSLTGPTVTDSFGNVDYYTTVPGDTPAEVAASFHLTDNELAEFNGLHPGSVLAPNTKLRLIPAPGPIKGAAGTAAVDGNGIPTSYTIEPDDTLAGITYRFGITQEQLAEANKVPYAYEKGNTYFVRAGNHIPLQKNPVDSRSGTGTTVNNSSGQTIFYTTVDGDSFDSIGYKFRCTTEQLLQYNTSLAADRPIPTGTKVRLIPGELKIYGAQGTFTADADGIPQTYTTAPGDTERQISLRFGMPDLEWANRPLTGTDRVWYTFTDLPSGELAPGQTISLNLTKPLHQ